MAMSLADFLEAIEDELGEAMTLVRDEQVIRWINRGRARLGIYQQKTTDFLWTASASQLELPADFSRFDKLVPIEASRSLPAYDVLGGIIRFREPERVQAGEARLYYGANYPEVTGTNASTMPAIADEAVVSYVLARYFKRIASFRADFRRYVSITGQNGVDVRDLLDIATDHDRDFALARDDFVTDAPSSFYGD